MSIARVRVTLLRTAVVVYEGEGLAVSRITHHLADRPELVGDLLMRVCVDDRRHRAGVLPGARRDLVRAQHGDVAQQGVRVLRSDDLHDAQLVLRIEEGPQQGDDESTGTAVDESLQLFEHVLLIELHEHVAEAVHALPHTDDHRLVDQRDRLLDPREVAGVFDGDAVRPLARPPDEDRVLEAPRRDEAERRTGSLDQRIDADRRRIADQVGVAEHRIQAQVGLLALDSSAFRKHTDRS